MGTPGQDEHVDVAAWRALVEQHRRNEERLSLALEAGRLGAWEWDVRTAVVTWSPALEEIHGLAVGTFDGTFDAYQRDIHPDDKARVLAAIEQGLEARTGHEIEYRIVRPDGEVRWLSARGRLQCDAAGAPVRVIGVCTDVTARRQADETREMFLSVLGHDLRNPLNAIMLAQGLLAEADDLPGGLQRPVGAIGRGAARMERIIGDLLDLARGRFGGGIPVERAQVDLAPVCRRVIEELELAHPTRAIVLEALGSTVGDWDGARAAQVVSNLVGNALVHGQGGVRVLLDGRDPRELVLTVHNGGRPVPPELLGQIFQPFVGRRSAGSLGLGLYIVHEIARAHGGHVTATSTEAAGTSLCVRWPREAP